MQSQKHNTIILVTPFSHFTAFNITFLHVLLLQLHEKQKKTIYSLLHNMYTETTPMLLKSPLDEN